MVLLQAPVALDRLGVNKTRHKRDMYRPALCKIACWPQSLPSLGPRTLQPGECGVHRVRSWCELVTSGKHHTTKTGCARLQGGVVRRHGFDPVLRVELARRGLSSDPL